MHFEGEMIHFFLQKRGTENESVNLTLYGLKFLGLKVLINKNCFLINIKIFITVFYKYYCIIMQGYLI